MGKLKDIVLILLFVTSFLWISKALLISNFPDFNVYYPASKVFLSGGNPYVNQPHFFTNFVYPPVVLLFFVPFTFLPLITAAKIWTFISLGSLLLSLYFLYKIYRIQFFSHLGLLFSIFTFCMFPVHFTLGMGQINLLILLCIVLCLYSLHKKKQKLSGIFIGLSISLKLFPVLFPFVFLFQKRWKTFTTLISILCILYICAFFIVKPNLNVYFFQNLLPNTFHSWKGDYYNQAVSGVIYRFGVNNQMKEFLRTVLTLCILFGSITMVFIKRRYSFMILSSFAIVTNLLINSFSWQHHFVWTIIPLLSIFMIIKQNKLCKFNYFLLVICYLLISINLKNSRDYPILLQSHVFFGTFFLWCFIIYLLFKKYDISTR